MQRGPIQNIGSSDEDDEYEEKDDEKPQVVQLKKGDLTKEEAQRIAKGKFNELSSLIVINCLLKSHDASAYTFFNITFEIY